jgi:tRNA/rRNA methyltransferase
MLYVVLVGAETDGNVGAIARAMANFDLKNLILVNPKCNHLSQEARNRAKHAQNILKKAKVLKSIPKLDTLIATSAITGTSYNPRSPLTPAQLKEKIPSKGKIGLMFGPESTGLSNEDLLKADFVVTISSSKKYPTLNLSHACTILLYELFNKENNINELASAKDKEVLLKLINKTLNKIKFSTKDKLKTQKIVWKRILGKSFLTKREAFSLIGYFKKIK